MTVFEAHTKSAEPGSYIFGNVFYRVKVGTFIGKSSSHFVHQNCTGQPSKSFRSAND